MQYLTTALILVSAARVAMSQSTCAAQNILDACLKIEQTQLDTCQSNDYQCLCDKYTNLLTCYNNCPGDSGKFGAQQNVVANCNAASVYATLTAKKTSAKASDLNSYTVLSGSATSEIAAAASSLTSKYASSLSGDISSLAAAASSAAATQDTTSTVSTTSQTRTTTQTSTATATGSNNENAASGLVVGLGRGGMGAAVALVGLGGAVVGWGIGGF